MSSVTKGIVFNFDMNFPCPIKIKSQGRQQKPPLYGLFRLHIKMVSWGLAQKFVCVLGGVGVLFAVDLILSYEQQTAGWF